MIFSSLEFLCVYLPVIFLLYCIMPGINLKNALLITASLLFYAYGEPEYVFLMIFSVIFNYVFARLIAKCSRKKVLLIMNVIVNLGILIFFKYTIFFIDTINQITGLNLKVFEIELPIGISFFTFQALSYVIDVYRGTVKVQKSLPKLLLYISFFPQLIAGPIVKYKEVSEALSNRKLEVENVYIGIRRFICGLGKKVLIANTVGQAADAVFNTVSADINILGAWIGAISYMLQIYYDFSGYSDMAIGLAKMFGFTFNENFCYPYAAVSIKEFWRRWHISLSTWFKEYLYIPIGGNRKGKIRTGINKFTVFFCTGLWHGANWTFVIWGLYHGFFSVIEEYFSFIKRLPKFIAYFYTMLIVCIGFVIFRTDNMQQGFYIIKQMFTGFSCDSKSMSFAVSLLTPWLITMIIAGFIGMAFIRPIKEWIKKSAVGEILLSAASVVLLVWCIIRLSGNTYNPFIYFRF